MSGEIIAFTCVGCGALLRTGVNRIVKAGRRSYGTLNTVRTGYFPFDVWHLPFSDSRDFFCSAQNRKSRRAAKV